MIYTSGTIAISGNTVTGTGTDFSAPLSLIRVGCTLIAVSDPIQIFTITEIKSGTELSVTPSANPAIPAGTRYTILLSDSISVDGLAQDVAETLRYYQSKETAVAEALEWSQDHIADKIGLGENYRDCPNISGDPSNYVGFTRILDLATGFPSVASGEWCLTGWIAQTNDDGAGVKTYSGVFVGYNTKSLYSYSYNTNSGVSWTRQARRDEFDRVVQASSETQLCNADRNRYIFVNSNDEMPWGCYSSLTGTNVPLPVISGGTGGRYPFEARTNLEAMHEQKTELYETNINSLTGSDSGFYYQTTSALATDARGYPELVAGSLLVVKNNANGVEGCTQLYFPYMADGYFWMRQRIVYDASWTWTSWKKFRSLDIHDSPTFENVVVDRASEIEATNGGTVKSILKDSSGTIRTQGMLYSEIRGNNKSYTTISNHRGDKNAYAAVTEDGDFVLSNGDFIGRTARLYSDVAHPFTLESPFPTIRFAETDKPEGSPEFSFIVDAGNWRIEKDHWSDNPGGNCISYSYSDNSISVPNFKASEILTPNDIHASKNNLMIPYTGIFKPTAFQAPSGAEPDKYYPVIIKVPDESNGNILTEIALTTASMTGDYVPNCNSLHLWARNGGWTDLGTVAFGHYYSYQQDENGILCVRASNKGFYQYIAIYVRGAAFPVLLSATVGSTVTIPTSDYKPSDAGDAPLFKWGITDVNDGINFEEYAIAGNILNFSSGLRGFYCNNEFRTHDGKPYVASDDNGVLIYDRGIRLHHSQDWNAQITDGINKFRPLEGAVNSPDPTVSFSGFHVQFATNYATQFAGRNSEFWARTYDNGTDGGWKKLATTNSPDQRWTANQNFVKTYINSNDFTRKLKIEVAETVKSNSVLSLWGSDTRPSVFEYGFVNPDNDEGIGYGFYCQLNTDNTVQFQVNGVVNCTTLNQSSDRDLKDNIQIIGDATEAIRKMNGYTYTLKENGLPYAGVIAQEVMEALPEAVGSFTHYGKALQGPTIDGNELREETRYLNVDYAAVTGLLVQVARETDNRVTELEEENASLRANIAVMDERITKLEALVRQLTGSEK